MSSKDERAIDWGLCTWEGSRRQQHRDFLALPFRTKLEIIEGLGEVAAVLMKRRAEQGLPLVGPSGNPLQLRVGETAPSYVTKIPGRDRDPRQTPGGTAPHAHGEG